ncbi:probable ATP-dependent RNA helicase DDX52 [Macrosteles quadrilineatus]|uniref:probable ATP-dependent RNA helicase DDX52 n=1 Tax=Macrosteles quadrilineatus TaxID=74068 RepID=UPI0023E122DC|nr:probable ATP-dependent RNA helicase DDX52 [Macrosteles quadrilineatus]
MEVKKIKRSHSLTDVKEEITSDEEELTLLGSIKSGSKKNVTSKRKKRNNDDSKKTAKKIAVDLETERINHLRNVHRITVVGENPPPPVESFEQLQVEHRVSKIIVKNLLSSGYELPTPIQMQAIPAMAQGRQILACAPTGSGKTIAFLVPMLHSLASPKNSGFRALIVCPTRELARQIFRECAWLSEGTGLRAQLIKKASLAPGKIPPNFGNKFDILITTPNRIIYLLRQEPPVLSLKSVQWLVVDESDKLFEAGPRGFRDQLAELYKGCDSQDVRRAMFSATHTVQVAKWCRKHLDNLLCITIGHRNTAVDLVKQELIFVGSEPGKLIEFRNLIQQGLPPPVLVFVQSKERAQELFSELIYDGINVDVIHADRTQQQRDNTVRAFREGKVWVLICTELMGRGIDFKGVNLVINYDFPTSAISYIHRIGRTGRAGRPGRAVTFFTEADRPILRSIATVMKDSGCEVPEYMLALKKVSKRAKRKLEQRAPERKPISTMPSYVKYRANRLKSKIESTKKKKSKKTNGPPTKHTTVER